MDKTVAEIAKERDMNPWTIYQYINVKHYKSGINSKSNILLVNLA